MRQFLVTEMLGGAYQPTSALFYVSGCVKNYEPSNEKSYEDFTAWLRCYNVEGMKNLEAGSMNGLFYMYTQLAIFIL